MIVHVIESGKMFSLALPKKIRGQYWLFDTDKKGKVRPLIGVEAIGEQWVMKSNRQAKILDEKKKLQSEIMLKPMSFFYMEIKDSEGYDILFAESMDESRQTFQKIKVNRPDEFWIGREGNNHICYDNRYVSGEHAKLSYDGEKWFLTDLRSTNGTYVNGRQITEKLLEAGDLIYIMGLRIVIGRDFLSVNNPDHKLKVRSTSFGDYIPQTVSREIQETKEVGNDYFYRSPSFHREIEAVKIQIDPPPQHEKLDTVPLALMLGPSLTMGMTSMGTGLLSLYQVTRAGGEVLQSVPTLMMSSSMLLGAVLWPVLTKRHEKKMKIKMEQKRQERYLFYLNEIEDDIKRHCKEQEAILLENFLSPRECQDRIEKRSAKLWEKRIGQKDFLNLRFGLGVLPLEGEIECPEKRFTMETDDLQNAMLSLKVTPKELINVPIPVSLLQYPVVGIYGERQRVYPILKSLLLQIVALHSYDEVKIMLLVDKGEEAEWRFAKWFPHIWSDDRKDRFFAAGEAEVKELSAYIEQNLMEKEKGSYHPMKKPPYFVVFIVNREAGEKCDALKRIIQMNGNGQVSIVTAADEWKDIPKEAEMVVSAGEERAELFSRTETMGRNKSFFPDNMQDIQIEAVAKKLANIELDLDSSSYILPDMLTFLELFQVGKIEHLNVLTRWKENNPVATLQTPVGVDTAGDLFFLDLHEKFHGPHGLVAGMTGSGKSEFIITYILSLAVNYHPDEVAFILIDYKGGGLAGAFEDKENGIKLPHLAGTITNLDGAAIKRSLVSIQSELRRRQAVFNEARRISREGTMDIYKYQHLYRMKVVPEPVPHLFIISDEFAELKTQQPEFMEQLISAARIGRSLGVHLILATQKPSGVVDDQIWSNSRFRVCLKVQERADSQDMIKSPDAASLSQTGRFYLQVGFNELFALGQSAWCGAEYQPSDTAEESTDTSIQVIDNLGHVKLEVKAAKKQKRIDHKIKQIVAVVQYLSDLAKEEGIEVKSLWLEPIPEYIFVEQLEEKYQLKDKGLFLNPVVGEYDDPFNQKQEALTIPLSEAGNCLVYGSTGSGKATFLTTLCYSLLKNHTAEELNLYLMDYGAETLKLFEGAPQIGGIVTASEGEKTERLFRLLNQEMELRKNLFSEYGGDYVSYCKSSQPKLPNIVVLLNNFSGFTEQYEEYQEEFNLLSRDGVKYGIYFVVTASGTNAVRYRTTQNFRIVFSLQLNDITDYPVVIGRTDGILPSKYKGRGLINLGRVYELQIAYCKDVVDRLAFLRDFVRTLKIEGKEKATPIPTLPQKVYMEHVEQKISTLKALPVGIATESLDVVCINLESRVLFQVTAQDPEGIKQFARAISQVLIRLSDITIVDAEQTIFAGEKLGTMVISHDFEVFVQSLFADMVERNNTYKDAGMKPASLQSYPERTYVIVGIRKLFEYLTEDGKDKLKVLLEKAEAVYKLHFVLLDSLGQYRMLESETWYRKHLSGMDGLWIGNGIAEQSLIRLNKISNELYEEIEEMDGYLISHGKAEKLRVLSATP